MDASLHAATIDPTRRALLAALAGGVGLDLAASAPVKGKKSKAGKNKKRKPPLATAVARVVATDITVDDGELVFFADLRIDAAAFDPPDALFVAKPLVVSVPIGPAAAVRAGIVRAVQEDIGDPAGLDPRRIDVIIL